MSEHLYIVAYDIANTKRWRRIFNVMHGYGEWVQLSIFQCRINPVQHTELIALLDSVIHHDQDHIILMDPGLADGVKPHIISLGKTFDAIEHAPIIV